MIITLAHCFAIFYQDRLIDIMSNQFPTYWFDVVDRFAPNICRANIPGYLIISMLLLITAIVMRLCIYSIKPPNKYGHHVRVDIFK